MTRDHEFCDNCDGCKPAVIDPGTGQVLPKDHPIMVKVLWVWHNETTYDQRRAFIRVCWHNSRKPEDLEQCDAVNKKFEAAMQEVS